MRAAIRARRRPKRRAQRIGHRYRNAEANNCMPTTFGYDWKSGYVSPWRSADGSTYATPPPVVDAVVDALVDRGQGETEMRPGSVNMVELGSGDGRICMAAARRGVRSLGIELDPELVQAAQQASVDLPLASFRHDDALTADLPDDATIVSYLLPAALNKIVPGLAARGVRRLISVRWVCDFSEWQPVHAQSIVADGSVWQVFEYVHSPGFEPDVASPGGPAPPRRDAPLRSRVARPASASSAPPAQREKDDDDDDDEAWGRLGLDLFAEVEA